MLRKGQTATTIYFPDDLYRWLKTRTIEEKDEFGHQLSLTRVVARYCADARLRIEGHAERFISANDGIQIEREAGQ
jgi:hypothetical protein